MSRQVRIMGFSSESSSVCAVVLLLAVLFADSTYGQDLNNLNVYELAWGFSLHRSCYVCAGCSGKGTITECPHGMARYCVETRYAPPIGPWKWDRYCYFVCPADIGANIEPYIHSRCCESDLCNGGVSNKLLAAAGYFNLLLINLLALLSCNNYIYL